MQDSLNNFQYYSAALDESVYVEDTAQLAIFVRGINSEFILTEWLVKLVPLKGSTIGKDIWDGFRECAWKIQLDLEKLVSVTTDGVPAMVCSKNGYVSLLEKHGKEIGNKRDNIEVPLYCSLRGPMHKISWICWCYKSFCESSQRYFIPRVKSPSVSISADIN